MIRRFFFYLVVSLLMAADPATASVVYDCTLMTPARVFSSGNVEFGDQVFLQGTNRIVTDFEFNYYVSTNANGNETAEVFFYANDGGAAGTEPGSLLYRSGKFQLDKGFNTVVLQALSVSNTVTLRNTFTWTAKFFGIDSDETVGLLLGNSPRVGTSFDDFWQKSTDKDRPWVTMLIDAGATPANFSARITAVAAGLIQKTTIVIKTPAVVVATTVVTTISLVMLSWSWLLDRRKREQAPSQV